MFLVELFENEYKDFKHLKSARFCVTAHLFFETGRLYKL